MKKIKMNNIPQIIYEDNKCSVVATGHDYDFIFYIENKSDDVIEFTFNDDSINDIYSEENTFTIKPNDWIGFLSESFNWNLLNNALKGNFRIMEVA